MLLFECDVWTVDPLHPDPEIIARAAAILRQGRLVAFPTETVYGLGANALDPLAVSRIFGAKGRPARNPVIVHVAKPEQAIPLASSWPKAAQQLAERFWPGPLTLVVPRSALIPDLVTAGGPTVALRCPAHPVALALIEAAGMPIAAPSANRSSEISPTLASHVFRSIGDRIDVILDGGPTPSGIESTVLDLSTDIPRLLRPGPIAPDLLESIIGPIQRVVQVTSGVPLPSPGLLARHYAPRTLLECWSSREEMATRVRDLLASGQRLGVIVPQSLGITSSSLKEVLLPPDPVGYAAGLYQALHDLDTAKLDRLVGWLPPETDEWLGVRDRLLRAATL